LIEDKAITEILILERRLLDLRQFAQQVPLHDLSPVDHLPFSRW
jgi:hypothetical protein